MEYVNPHGQNTPPAGLTPPGTNPNGGENPDGFYQVGSTDSSQVYVIDTATGTKFGPYPSGTVIKYTEANGADPKTLTIGSTSGQAGAVTGPHLRRGRPGRAVRQRWVADGLRRPAAAQVTNPRA